MLSILDIDFMCMMFQGSYCVQPVPYVGVSDTQTAELASEMSVFPGYVCVHGRPVRSRRIFQQIRLGLSTSKGTEPVRSVGKTLKSLLSFIILLIIIVRICLFFFCFFFKRWTI